MDLVFAYGSNMALGDVRRWFRERRREAGSIHVRGSGTLPGFRLVWNYRSPTRGAGAANVERSPGSRVQGVVLEVDDVALEGLDVKEGRYERALQRVVPRDGGALSAWVYTVLPVHRVARFVPPRRAYLELMIEAARRHGLDGAYVEELRAVVVDDGRYRRSRR